VQEFSPGFQPPQTAMNDGTGLYCGEHDMFAFLTDPTGWTEIEGQAFAPGVFAWNSKVGRRSLGIQTGMAGLLDCTSQLQCDVYQVPTR